MSDAMHRAKTGEEIDQAFENSEDMRQYFDFSSATLEQLDPNEQKAMSISLPAWLFDVMDAEAARRGTSRASVVKNWLVDRADQELERRERISA